jgi:protein ImuA
MARFGLAADRLIVVHGAAPRDLLWAAEEGLRCRKVGAVVLEGVEADLTAGRRLQLAAESGGTIGFTLMAERVRPSGAASSRWRIRSAASAPTPWHGIGAPRWQVTLERCRSGTAANWLVEWREDEDRLAVL